MKYFGALLVAPLAALAAPILEARGGEAIPDSWIAILKPEHSTETVRRSVISLLGGATPRYSYQIGSFKGYSLSASDDLINSIAKLDEIAYVEPDVTVNISSVISQDVAPWGLARISSREPGGATYSYDETAGEGTYAYIVDSGIQIDHPEFGGRATFGANFVQGTEDVDDNGHGTHVAGTTGSETYGVAKKTNLIAVKVLDAQGSGAVSQFIAGLQWAVDDATEKSRMGKAVVNISLGALRILSASINTAARAAVDAGMFLAVAAGNDNMDASQYAPASEPSVCTVGATNSADARAPFSNYGASVDVFAPGVDVTSTWNNGSTSTISGTSMAAPHIAGLGAYLLALEGPRDPVELCERIQEYATPDIVKNALSVNNLLAYNNQA
ncbi:oryzin precursor [Hypoxylon sp. FL1284]|nr:oryzin precursor [Hypoxylon sp. FL1284]